MPMIPGLGRSASYVLDALGGTAEKAASRVAAKAETKAGRRYLNKLANTRAGRSNTAQVRQQAYQATKSTVAPPSPTDRPGDYTRRMKKAYPEQRMRAQASVAMRRETGVRRASLAVGAGGIGMMSGRGPNESRTSYRGPGRTPGLRNSVGTGRYA